MPQRKTILLELNEIPPRVLDAWCGWEPGSALARLLPRCRQYVTVAEEPVPLSPWITWPSLHRGVAADRHGILNFGQPLDEVDRAFPPLWCLLARAGVTTGVFGSLHSQRLPSSLAGYAFFVPDTFAAGSETFPESLEPYQAFNLRAARASSLNVARGLPWGDALRFLARAPQLGLTLPTAATLGRHLLAERLAPWKTARRRTMQVVLAFDIFLRELTRTRPGFATFFTNHVASSMHRFWAAAFPEDYDEFDLPDDWVETYRGEIAFTMSHADRMVSRLVRFVEDDPSFRLVIATSMGQAATRARHVETILGVADPARFLALHGVPTGGYVMQPAMFPQLNVLVPADDHRASLREGLRGIRVEGEAITWDEKPGGFFSVTFGHVDTHHRRQVITLAGREVAMAEAGVSPLRHEEISGSSAYHVPEGTLLVFEPGGAPPHRGRPQVSTLDVAPWLLSDLGAAVPSYMRRPRAL